ncbi:MAG: MarR family transcriptional regulator [Clostridia bacterium]|nr:MarR family transcriptional regulator [Clostridia bacterium]
MKEVYNSIPSKVSSLRHAMNLFLVDRMKKAGWKDISPSHGGIIYALLNNELLTMKEIAESVKRDPSTVTTLVNKLVKLGYAEYIKNPTDMRSKYVRLTEQGRSLNKSFSSISDMLINTIVDGIPDEEIDAIIITIEKMRRNVLGSLNE